MTIGNVSAVTANSGESIQKQRVRYSAKAACATASVPASGKDAGSMEEAVFMQKVSHTQAQRHEGIWGERLDTSRGLA